MNISPDIDDNKTSCNNHNGFFFWLNCYLLWGQQESWWLRHQRFRFFQICFIAINIYLYLIPTCNEFCVMVSWSVVTLTNQCLVKHKIYSFKQRIYMYIYTCVYLLTKYRVEWWQREQTKTKSRTKMNWFFLKLLDLGIIKRIL